MLFVLVISTKLNINKQKISVITLEVGTLMLSNQMIHKDSCLKSNENRKVFSSLLFRMQILLGTLLITLSLTVQATFHKENTLSSVNINFIKAVIDAAKNIEVKGSGEKSLIIDFFWYKNIAGTVNWQIPEGRLDMLSKMSSLGYGTTKNVVFESEEHYNEWKYLFSHSRVDDYEDIIIESRESAKNSVKGTAVQQQREDYRGRINDGRKITRNNPEGKKNMLRRIKNMAHLQQMQMARRWGRGRTQARAGFLLIVQQPGTD